MTLRDRLLLLAAGGAAVYTLMREFRKQDETLAQIQQVQADLQQDLTDQSRYITQQNQSLLWLYTQFEFTAPLPGMRGWYVSPDFAALLVELLRKHQPEVVLEFGGGTSTMIVAKTLQQLGRGHIITVDAIDHFAEITQQNVNRQGLADYVTVMVAPTTRVELNGRGWMWYDTDILNKIEKADFMIVDGPSQFNSPHRMVRYPALPCMHQRLTDNAVVVLDDTNREDEAMIAKRWQEEFPEYKQTAEYEYFEKGAIILQRQP